MTARLSMLILVYSRAWPRRPHPIPQMDVEETLVPACTALHRTALHREVPPRRALWDIPRTRQEKEEKNIIGLRHARFDSRKPADCSRPTIFLLVLYTGHIGAGLDLVWAVAFVPRHPAAATISPSLNPVPDCRDAVVAIEQRDWGVGRSGTIGGVLERGLAAAGGRWACGQ